MFSRYVTAFVYLNDTVEIIRMQLDFKMNPLKIYFSVLVFLAKFFLFYYINLVCLFKGLDTSSPILFNNNALVSIVIKKSLHYNV